MKLVPIALAAAFTLSLDMSAGAVAAPLQDLGYDTGGATIELARSINRGGGGRHWSGGGNWGGRGNWHGGRHWNGNWGGRGHWNGGWGGGWGWPGFGFGLGAGLLGFGLGAAIANDRYNDYYGYDYQYADDHVARCAARYRSYDPASDTFLGYDGYRHPCNL